MDRCDDCSSDAIDLSANPVPFGDYYHYVAHVSTTILYYSSTIPIKFGILVCVFY